MHLLRRNLLCKEKEKKISHVKVHDVCTAQKQLECFVLPSINFLFVRWAIGTRPQKGVRHHETLIQFKTEIVFSLYIYVYL